MIFKVILMSSYCASVYIFRQYFRSGYSVWLGRRPWRLEAVTFWAISSGITFRPSRHLFWENYLNFHFWSVNLWWWSMGLVDRTFKFLAYRCAHYLWVFVSLIIYLFIFILFVSSLTCFLAVRVGQSTKHVFSNFLIKFNYFMLKKKLLHIFQKIWIKYYFIVKWRFY